VGAIDAITTYDAQNKKIAIFIVNRSLTETIDTSILLSGFTIFEIDDQITMTNTEWMATNNASNPNRIKPSKEKTASCTKNHIKVKLHPVSWQVIHVSVEAL
jgi:alpha-L-arabinofuranosidase